MESKSVEKEGLTKEETVVGNFIRRETIIYPALSIRCYRITLRGAETVANIGRIPEKGSVYAMLAKRNKNPWPGYSRSPLSRDTE